MKLRHALRLSEGNVLSTALVLNFTNVLILSPFLPLYLAIIYLKNSVMLLLRIHWISFIIVNKSSSVVCQLLSWFEYSIFQIQCQHFYFYFLQILYVGYNPIIMDIFLILSSLECKFILGLKATILIAPSWTKPPPIRENKRRFCYSTVFGICRPVWSIV